LERSGEGILCSNFVPIFISLYFKTKSSKLKNKFKPLFKVNFTDQAQWSLPVVPATQEAKAGEL
jgi:hypothetical protein